MSHESLLKSSSQGQNLFHQCPQISFSYPPIPTQFRFHRTIPKELHSIPSALQNCLHPHAIEISKLSQSCCINLHCHGNVRMHPSFCIWKKCTVDLPAEYCIFFFLCFLLSLEWQSSFVTMMHHNRCYSSWHKLKCNNWTTYCFTDKVASKSHHTLHLMSATAMTHILHYKPGM